MITAKTKLALIGLVFFGPLMLATWMYSSGNLTPEGSSNNGALLTPVINIGDALPDSAVIPLADGNWLMLYTDTRACSDACRDALYRQRQTRLMLGKEMDRVVRVFLHGDSAIDKVFLEGEHPGLKTINDKALGNLLEEKRPQDMMPGGIYLFDPLANLVMYFPPDLEPRDMVDDIKHLLKLSRIG